VVVVVVVVVVVAVKTTTITEALISHRAFLHVNAIYCDRYVGAFRRSFLL
jgi:hypothetical protein